MAVKHITESAASQPMLDNSTTSHVMSRSVVTFKYTIEDGDDAVEIYYSDDLLQHPDDPHAPSEYVNVAFLITDDDPTELAKTVSPAEQIPSAWQPV